MARIETLHEFTLRAEWYSKGGLHIKDKKFVTNGRLRAKVNEDGSLTNRDNPEGDWYKEKYCGNTLVFLLDEETRERLGEIQELLYASSPSILAEPLEQSVFHMTLHDLKSGIPTPELLAQMERSEKVVRPCLREIKTGGVVRIKMRATGLFSLRNASVVLGLTPVDEENCGRLMTLYELFQRDESIRLPYRLTPHITIAYYRTGCFDESRMKGLMQIVREVNRRLSLERPLEIELSTERLMYQTFTDMNHYRTVE